MRNEEVRPCAACGKGLSGGNPGPMVGARVILQRLMVNPTRLQQHVGVETFFGGGTQGRVLADVMGLGAGSAIDEPTELRDEAIICENCMLPVLAIFEQVNERKTAAEFEEAPADA